MKNKVEFNVEVLLPLQVTESIAFPYLTRSADNTRYNAVAVNDADSKYVPYTIIEVVLYDSGRNRIYEKTAMDYEVGALIADVKSGKAQEITLDEFMEAYSKALNTYTQLTNVLTQ